MTKLLLTRKKPLSLGNSAFLDAFEEYSATAESIYISTGYVSVEALQFLLANAKEGRLPYLDLTIGMHYFDGITKAQYDSVIDLSNHLMKTQRGKASICVAFPYHGKIYSFHKTGKPFAAILGSSNLSALNCGAYNFEVDTTLENPSMLIDLYNFQTQLREKACKSVDDWKPKKFIESIKIPGATRLEGKETADYWCLNRIQSIQIPLKAEQKSNLNACFGKGRKQKNQLIRPRPWYEVELIVPLSTTKIEGYPRNSVIQVVTDDGWMFKCKTSGDYSKNFRSKDDLCILGGWLKGRLESAQVLKVGQHITLQMLESYGRSHLELIRTSEPDIWLLDFGTKNSRG